MFPKLFFVCLALIVLTACGSGRQTASDPSGTRQEPRDHWEEIAPRCAGFPAKEHCDDGDMALFGGLLCASGDERGCDLVRSSQGPDGRWWRSPRRNPGNLGSDHSFSRDMAMGVLLYLVTTRDAAAARRWVTWIEANRPCLTQKPDALGGGCLVRGPHRFCTDEENQSCTINPGNWALIGRVFDSLGLSRNDEMRRYRGYDGDTLPVQARHAPLGYESHLPGVEVLLKQRLDEARPSREEAARILADKQPDNPFFVYLLDGPSPALASQVRGLCPKPDGGGGSGGRRSQWAWERDTAGQAWKDSMGWDCLFMANVLGD